MDEGRTKLAATVRRAERSDEQREEARRKQREYQRRYRERKKAEFQNSSAICSFTTPGTIYIFSQNLYSQIIMTGTNHYEAGTNHVTMDQNFPLLLNKENIQPTAEKVANGKYQLHNVKMPPYFYLYCNKYNAGTHRFGVDQNSPIIVNEDNIEPTTDVNHSHSGLLIGTTIESSLPLDSGNYQIYKLHLSYLFFNIWCNLCTIMTDLTNGTLHRYW